MHRLSVHVLVGLEVGCIAGILCLGARLMNIDRTASTPIDGWTGNLLAASDVSAEASRDRSPTSGDLSENARDPSAARVAMAADSSSGLWVDQPVGNERASAERSDAEDRPAVGKPVAVERRKERDYYRALLTHGTADVERAARTAVAGQGPNCEKVAALRAVRDMQSPGAYDLYADAIMTLPDVSGPQADSVPRFAVRVLIDEASRADRAHQALDRVAWNRAVSSDLRRIAAAGLASIANEADAWQILSRLELEQDPDVRESAARALARNSAAGSAGRLASRFAVQGTPSSPLDGDAGEHQE